MDATLAELKAIGYRKLTFDGVAARAGTSKAVLYRRWNSRFELVVAALRSSASPIVVPAPDTGSLRGDLLATLEGINQDTGSLPADISLGLLADTVDKPKEHEFLLQNTKRISASIIMPALTRAEARGEIATAALPERIITLPIDLTRHEVLLTGKPASKAAIVQIVDDIYLPLLRSLR